MSLRREFRSQLTRGAWQYATVESTAMGKATVRLAQNGARITNCQILGADVEVGEKVVLDYSAEGAPIVRPYTIKGEQIPEEPEQPAEPEPAPSSWCYARYTISDQSLGEGSGCYAYIQDAPIGDDGLGRRAKKAGFAYGSYSGQYRYQVNFENTVPFDEVIFDNIGVNTGYPNPINSYGGSTYNMYGKGYFTPPRGSYLVNVVVALDIGTNDVGWMWKWSNLMCRLYGMTPGFNYGENVKVSQREGHAIFKYSGFFKYEGPYWWASQGYYTNHVRVLSVLDSAGANIYSSALYPYPDYGRMTYLKYAKKEGAYPLLEMYKIADMGRRRTCIPQWNWEDYEKAGN